MEFDADLGKYPNGCRIFMENLPNKVVSSPQYWINEEYKFSFTHTLKNLDNIKENYFWIYCQKYNIKKLYRNLKICAL